MLEKPITPGRYRTRCGDVDGPAHEASRDIVGRLTDPDSLPDPPARMRRENERLRAANRLHEIARDCCAAEVERLREMVADLESQLAFANDCADMRDREVEILREQMSERGDAPQIGLTIAGEIVRVPDSLPDSSVCPDCRH